MKTIKIGHIKIPVYRIPVKYDEGENWGFVWINGWDGKRRMAVF